MNEQAVLGACLDTAAELIRTRLRTLDQALGELERVSHLLFAERAPAPATVEAWLHDSGFGVDEYGYFTQLAPLRALRETGRRPDDISYFWPRDRVTDPTACARMFALRASAPLLRGLHHDLGGDIDYIYYQDETNTVVTYPFIDARVAIPPDFDWHGYPSYRSVCPEANPERSTRWALPPEDLGGQGPFGILSRPLYCDDRFIGLWSLDVPWRRLHRDCLPCLDWAAGQAFVLDRSGRILVHETHRPRVDAVRRQIQWGHLAELGGDFARLLPEAAGQAAWERRLVDGAGVEHVCIGRALAGLDWVLLVLLPAHRLTVAARAEVNTALDHLRAGNLAYRIVTPADSAAHDLAEAYNRMAAELETERQRQTETSLALRASERAYERLVHFSLQALFILQDRRVAFANPAAARLIGCGVDALLAFSPEAFAACLRPEDWERLMQPQRQGPDPGQPEAEHYEMQLLRQDGSMRWVDVHASAIEFRGHPAVQAVCIDVTERKQAELRLRESERRYRQLFDEMRDIFFLCEVIWDDDGAPADLRFIEINSSTEALLGRPRSEVLGRSWRELGLPAVPALLERYGRVAASGVEERFGYAAALNRRHYRINAFSPGRSLVAAIATDITEAYAAEEALRATVERVRLSLEGTGVGLWDWDLAAGSVTFVRHWAEILGYPPEAIYGTGAEMWLDHIHPEDREWVLQAWQEHLAGRTPGFEAVHRLRAWDGEWRWVLDKGQVIARDAAGHPLRAVGVHMDVTDQERSRAAVTTSRARLAVLHDVDRAVLAARSPAETARAVLRRIHQLIPCRRASVTFFDGGRRRFEILAVRGRGARRGPSSSLPLDLNAPAMARLRRDEVIVTHSLEEARTLPFPAHVREHLRRRGLQVFLVVPLLARRRLIGTLNLAGGSRDGFAPEQVDIARELARSLAISIQQAELFKSIRSHQAQLRALGVRLANAEEGERQRLARELHDQVGQGLTALGLNLNLLQGMLGPRHDRQVDARLDDSLRRVKDTMDTIRTVMTDLRPTVLDDYGLPAALRWYAKQFSERASLPVTVRVDPGFPRLDAVVETALFRIAQEALTNVARHAAARRVTLALDMRGAGPRLTIEDDGVGFDPDRVPRGGGGGAGLGLLSMQERALAAAAQLKIVSRPGHGTRVRVQARNPSGPGGRPDEPVGQRPAGE